jgi:hypothetical protein
MPLSEAQEEERRIRKQAAIEHANRGIILVEQNGWFGVFSTEHGGRPELISRDREVAEKALALRRQDDPSWRDVR